MQVGRLIFRLHAVQRMHERGFGTADVHDVLAVGKIIEEYAYPFRLMLGWTRGRPVHVVAASDSLENATIVITVYVPRVDRWEPGFERRRV